MVYQDKIDRVREIISDHNANLDTADHISFENFISKLKKSGGTTEETLIECTWEDLEDCGLPRLLAKKVTSIFRTSSKVDSSEKFVSAKKAERMSLSELVHAFDPEEYTSAVAKRLDEIAQSRPFIVYKTGRIVDTTETLNQINELKRGYPPLTEVTVDGEVKKVYKLGELPSDYVNENPLYPSRPLRKDDDCCQTGRSWAGVPLSVRQLVRIIYDEHYKRSMSIESVHSLIQQAVSPDAEKQLRLKYRKAALKFDELKEADALPKLRISLGTGGAGKKSDPPSGGPLNGKRVEFPKTVTTNSPWTTVIKKTVTKRSY